MQPPDNHSGHKDYPNQANRLVNNSLPSNHNQPIIRQRKWFPHTALSLFMLVLWLLLVNEINAGQLLLGAALAWLIPWLTQDFWPESLVMRRPATALRFIGMVFKDILIANLALVRRILGPVDKLQPAFMVLPLDIEHEFTITLLASTISLTPGTVCADLSVDGRYLLIHSIHVIDTDAAIKEMKQRYEAPLKEIFECYKP